MVITIINIKNIKTVSITTWSFHVCSRYYTTTQQVHLSVPLTPLTLSTTRFRQNHYAAPGGNSNTFFIVIVIINT